MMSIDYEYNEYHYPKQNYDGDRPQYHYGTDIQESSYSDSHQTSSQSENKIGEDTNAALMLEEDDDNTVY